MGSLWIFLLIQSHMYLAVEPGLLKNMINSYMNSIHHKLFLYNDVRHMMLSDARFLAIDKENSPMNNNPIKVHKGVDNLISFRVLSPDRQPVNIRNYTAHARIISAETNELVLEKACVIGTARGVVFLELNEGDLANVSPGRYHLAMLGQKDFVHGVVGEVTSTPFFTDLDSNVVATLEVTQQAEKAPHPSFEIGEDDWSANSRLLNGSGPIATEYYSSAIPGNRVRNHLSGTHTFSIWAEAFTGTLEVLGTLDLSPNANPNFGWFRVMVTSGDDILEFINFTGTEAWSFQANFMWLKFRYIPSLEVTEPGTVKKIWVRS